MPEMKIEKDIEIEIEDWEVNIRATNRTVRIASRISDDLPPEVEIEHIPEFIELLRRIHADITNNYLSQ